MSSIAPTDRSDLHRNTVRTVSVGTLWRVLRYPFVILSLTFIPRLMGDSDYGHYCYYMSIFLILDMLTDFGFLQMFGRFLPEGTADLDDPRSRALLEGTLLYGTLLPVGAWLLFGLAGWINPAWAFFPPLQYVLLGLTLVFNRIAGSLFLILYGRNQIACFSAREVLRSTFTFLLVWGFYLQFGLTGALTGLLFNEISLTLIGLWWTRAWVFRRWTAIRFRDFAPFLIFGLTFYLPAFLFGLMQRSGNVLVKWITGSSEQVAYYDVANQFLLLTATFLGLILSTLIPALSALQARGDSESIARWQGRIAGYCAIALVLSFYALLGFGSAAITLCLGPKFLPVVHNALVVILATPAILVATVGMNYALLEKRPATYLQSVAGGAIVMALAGLVLIPRGLSTGACWATVLGYTTMAIVFAFHYRSQFRLIFPQFGRILIAGIIPAGAFLFSPVQAHPFLACLAITAAFFLLLMTARIWHPSDLLKLLQSFRNPPPE
jgi:O-antigen/teichoic acid export membrane protein